MNAALSHRGYTGSIEASKPDNLLYGEVLGIQSLIMYEGTTLEELVTDFEESVDEYIANCIRDGIEPEKPGTDILEIELSLDTKAKIIDLAARQHRSPNQIAADILEASV